MSWTRIASSTVQSTTCATISRRNTESSPSSLTSPESHKIPEKPKIDVSRNPIYWGEWTNGSIREIFIPFEGEAGLFKFQASTGTFNPPRGRVDTKTNNLVMTFKSTSDRYEGVAEEVKSDIERLKRHIEFSNNDVAEFNSEIRQQARTRIESRRERILKIRNVDASLPFPMRSRTDGKPTYAVPEVRRKIVPKLPDASETPFAPEPILADADYEHVLSVISSLSLSMERSPSAFATLDEEALRSHCLALLNGHYDGQATGETFNHSGKTDILIRSENKNIFVAECKFWTGPKGFNDAINQLLGYTCWRDTKAALIVFNRDTQMSTVLDKIPSIVESHDNYKRTLSDGAGETSFRYHFGASRRHGAGTGVDGAGVRRAQTQLNSGVQKHEPRRLDERRESKDA